MYSFRCKNCGHLHHSDFAGEADHPHACAACGAGVTFGPDKQKLEEIIAANSGGKGGTDLAAAIRTAMQNPNKQIHPDNWEHLSEASEDRLTELGLTRTDVCKPNKLPKTESSSEKVLKQEMYNVHGREEAVTQDKIQ